MALVVNGGSVAKGIYKWLRCALAFRAIFFSRQPLSLHKTGGLSDNSPPFLCHLSYDIRLS